MKRYGKSILDRVIKIKLRKGKSVRLSPNEAQKELNRLRNERIDLIPLSIPHTMLTPRAGK
jgi:hypothetical protein